MSSNKQVVKKKGGKDSQLDKQFKDGKRLAFLGKLNKKFAATTKNEDFKAYSKQLCSNLTKTHVQIVKDFDGAMLAVQADPKTHEMRRDLLPEIRKYRLRYLRR